MIFQVGDKVRLREDLVVGEEYDGMTFLDSMKEEFGKTLRIKEVSSLYRWCLVEGTRLGLVYGMEMFELVEDEEVE